MSRRVRVAPWIASGAAGALLFVGVPLTGAAHAAIGDEPCRAEGSEGTVTEDRDFDVWYGSTFQGAAEVLVGTQLTTMIVPDVSDALQADASLDPRAKSVAAFVDTTPPVQSWFEWTVDASPTVLPGEAALRTALANGNPGATFDPAINRGTSRYLIGTSTRSRLRQSSSVTRTYRRSAVPTGSRSPSPTTTWPK